MLTVFVSHYLLTTERLVRRRLACCRLRSWRCSGDTDSSSSLPSAKVEENGRFDRWGTDFSRPTTPICLWRICLVDDDLADDERPADELPAHAVEAVSGTPASTFLDCVVFVVLYNKMGIIIQGLDQA